MDHQESRRYRESYSFPGVELNEIGGARYGRLLAEWTLPPLRFRRLGFPIAYLNWLQPILFSSGLVTDPEIREKFEELRYLERLIGKTGKQAVAPFVHTRSHDLWQLYKLAAK